MKPMTTDVALGDHTPQPGSLLVNEVFYSIQGEGARVGTPMVFVRLSRCNLRCSRFNRAGFDCDTDFQGGRVMTLDALEGLATSLLPPAWRGGEGERDARPWLLWTGGEPGLQLTDEAVAYFKERDWLQGVESNGTIKLPDGLDHITVSPKTAEHTIRQRVVDELRVVRAHGQALPVLPHITATTRFLSPAFEPDGTVDPATVAWCVRLVKENPAWRLSLQTHKLMDQR